MDSARWEAFFRACGIAQEATKLYAEIFLRERIGPDLLSDLCGENLKELGIGAFGDRLRILKYVNSTNGNPPEFAQDKGNDGHANHSRQNTPDVLPSYATVSTSRSLSASSDVTAQGAGQPTAPLAENLLLAFDSHHFAEGPSAAQLKHEPTEQVSDAYANDAGQRPAAAENGDPALSHGGHYARDETAQVEYKELEPLEAIPDMPKGGPSEPPIPLNVSLTSHELERFLTAMEMPLYRSVEWQPPSSSTLTCSGARRDHQPSSLAIGTQLKGESNTPVKTGKIRLPRSTASASRRLPHPPIETHHEDELPPPDERNALLQMSIDQLRRNGQLKESDHDAWVGDQNPCTKTSKPGNSKPGGFFLRSSGHPPTYLPNNQIVANARRKGTKVIKQRARKTKRANYSRIRGMGMPMCFPCSTCNKSYADKKGLMRHKDSHANERRYACTHCASRFIRADYLHAHLERVHALEKPLKCDKCHRSFSLERFFLRHTCLTCAYCSRIFRWSDSYKNHLKSCKAKKPLPK